MAYRLRNSGRFQFTGQMWIPEAAVYHFKARAYHPYHPGARTLHANGSEWIRGRVEPLCLCGR